MNEFVKGDMAVWNSDHGWRMTKGKAYEVLSVSEHFLHVVTDNGERDGWHYANFAPRQVGPVRTETVTKRRIVPGVYGRLEVGGVVDGRVHVMIQKGEYAHRLTAEELDSLAMVASQLAEVLRDS